MNRRLLLAVPVLLIIGVAVWYFTSGSDSAVPNQPESVDGVSMEITACTTDGGSIELKNGNDAAMQFAAAVDFTDRDGAVLFPVRISVDLEPGASRVVQMPFGGEISDPGDLRCSGELLSVTPI